MRLKKRGEVHPLPLVVGAVVLLIVAIVLFVIIKNSFSSFVKIGKCQERGAHCVASVYGVGCPEGEYQETGLSGCTESEICCMPSSQTPGTASQFNAKEQTALQNAIILTLNKDTKPISDRAAINLRADNSYEFHISINDQLLNDPKTKAKLGPCAVYVIDSREQGKKYLLDKSEQLIPATDPIDLTGRELANCTSADFKTKKYTPLMFDAYKELTLYIILFDNWTGDEYKNRATNEHKEKLIEMYSNTDHWLAMRAYRLVVEPVVKISGVSGEWVNKDDITITCTDCDKIWLKLVRSDKGNFADMLKDCTDLSKDSDFKSSLDYISGTMTKTTGIPLNIDIGGFRLPSQQKIMYVTDSKPITVAKNKATVSIDRATLLKTFYNGDYKFFVGDTTYLCAKATKYDKDTKSDMTVGWGLSETSLKVDVMPPYLNPDDIKVVYPDQINSTLRTTPYYYRTYPTVRIPDCYDYGQSGCARYDYYIHTGNFINLRLSSGDIGTGIKALLLTEGLNALLNNFAAKDAINTICPFLTSSDYLSNTHQEIRFRDQGQGIICIRVSDKAGNSQIVYTSLWTPEEMFKRIIANQTQELMSEITS